MSDEQPKSYEDVVKENEELRAQLEDATEVLTAVRTGAVDALVVEGPKGAQVYSLRGADHPYRIFVEHMNEGAVTVDETGMVVYANRVFAGLVGLSLDHTVGREFVRFFSPAERLRWDELARDTNGEVSQRELTLSNASGESIPVLLSTRHLPIEPGRFYCCIVSDLRRQRLQERLNSSLQDRLRGLAIELNLTEQRERKRLATELHDYLAQLLVVGKMYLDRIKPGTGEPVPLFQKLDETLDEALTYTRTLVAQLSPPFFQEFGLPYALKWLAEQMEPQGLHLTVEVQDGSLVLTEDHATLMFQATRELLMNVLKHAGTDYARLAMTMAEGTVRIELSDDGRGFDVDALGSASAIGTQGRFGLFSIRERMIAMGGRFELVSRPGKGTRATLVVPLNCAADVRIEESRARTELTESQDSAFRPQNSPGSSEKIRALLVDDHAMVRQGLRSILEAYADMEIVGEAAAGDEAVELVHQLRPSVVVMDINMPRMNGIEATAKIKARHSGVVVIGLSVQTDEFARTEMLRAGASTLMTKEAAVEELYHTIQRELQERTCN